MVPEIQGMTDSFFIVLGQFLPFDTPNNALKFWKNEKKKTPVDIIILLLCIANENHMIYFSWDIRHNRQSFSPFWANFLPFDPPNKPKNQNFEKMKTSLEILSIYACVPQMTIIWCMVPEIWSAADRNGHFGLFLPFYPLGTRKLKNKSGDIIILHKCIINDNHSMYGS